MADVVKVEREMVGQIVDAGCTYIHIDEPGFTAYADEAVAGASCAAAATTPRSTASARSTRTTS